MSLRISLSLRHALLQCLHCKRLVGETVPLENGQCPCGAVLISVDVECSNLESTQTEETAPSHFEDITFGNYAQSNDEFLAASGSNRVMKIDPDDAPISFNQNPRSSSNSSAKRKQEEMSDTYCDDTTKSSTKEMRQDLSNSKAYIKQHNSKASSIDSEYQPSSSEDMSLSETSRDKPKATKRNKYQEARAASTTSSLASSAPSTPFSLPATVLRPDRSSGLWQFNKEMRGQLAKMNADKTPKELTQIVSDMWNNLSEEQKRGYTLKASAKNTPKREKKKDPAYFLNLHGYNLYISEHAIKGTARDYAEHWRTVDPEIKKSYTQKAREMKEDWIFENPDEYQAYESARKAKHVQRAKASKERSS